MKKRLLFFACLGMLFSLNLSAQTTPFSVKWETLGTGSSSYNIAKTTVGSVAGTGLEVPVGATADGNGNFGLLGTLQFYTYSASATAVTATSNEAWSRHRATGTAPNFSDNDVINTAHYAQYIVEPINDKYLRITDIGVAALGGGTGSLRMVVKYSIDGVNFIDMPANATYYDATGATANTYAAKDVATAIPLTNSGTAAQSQDKRTITYSGLQINVDKGQKVYFRFYPFLNGTTASSRYLFLRSSVFSGVTSDTTLPLDLLSFSAKPDALGKTVNLNWKTANEVNTQDFVVERRTDDTEFASVGTVLSKNVSGTHSYSFSDQKAVAGNSYYRLKQRDKDGTFTYSDIANVKIEGISLSLHPNPVVSELVVNHDYVKKSSVLKVLSLDGKNVIKTNTAVGSSSTTINVAALASGTYLLVQDADGKTQSQKFIKK
ncbi:MAG: T9SS type A sorting domain-containing protein [Chitinophagaceae bacterium]|nr:MAG: T9SS type A sorting domain-containing protein [Chitinophagaceae bacterium]